MTSSFPSYLQVSLNPPKHKKSSSTSVDAVIGNNDLVTQILLRVPAKSVLKFKLVSKKWLSIISHPSFAIRHTQLNPHTISALLLRVSFLFEEPIIYQFLSLDGKSVVNVPSNFLCFDPNNPGSTYISQPRNGLHLCYKGIFCSIERNKPTYVFNPTTRQFVVLPPPPPDDKIRLNQIQLVFDPSKSPYYKVLCVPYLESMLEIHVYSSETKIWKLSVRHENFDMSLVNLNNGVFWNGAVHWIDPVGNGFCVLVDEECLQAMPSPPLPESWEANNFRYFGESSGQLHFIGLLTGERNPDVMDMGINVSPDMSADQMARSCGSNSGSQFIVVYAMDNGYSNWFVKYYLDVNAIVMAYPEIMEDPTVSPCLVDGSIYVTSFIEGNNEEGPSLVINMPGEIISYSFKGKTFKKLFSFHPWEDYTCSALKYTETLSWI